MTLYISTKLRENSSKGFKFLSRHGLQSKIFKGESFKKCRRRCLFFSAHGLMALYICIKLRENVPKGVRV